tara:strand:- start:2170 stop:2847 length:678 start_codon:yes stop_codon:yes gene_type:complete
MGNWVSLWSTDVLAKPKPKDEVVRDKLQDYVKGLKMDLKCITLQLAETERAFNECHATFGITTDLHNLHIERCASQKQQQSVQAAITAVTEQLNTLYQQNLNHNTMVLMRESAMVMLKTSQSGVNPDKTLSVMDDYNDSIEEKSELAAHMFAAVKQTNVPEHAIPAYDESWDTFVKQNTPDQQPAPAQNDQDNPNTIIPHVQPRAEVATLEVTPVTSGLQPVAMQ